MIERWRLFRGDVVAIYHRGWQLTLFAGWSSFAVGFDLERHRYESTLTIYLGFVQLVLERWPR